MNSRTVSNCGRRWISPQGRRARGWEAEGPKGTLSLWGPALLHQGLATLAAPRFNGIFEIALLEDGRLRCAIGGSFFHSYSPEAEILTHPVQKMEFTPLLTTINATG
jgi:hypothetical protein